MKQRMYNTFLKKIGKDSIARLLANIGYAILMVYYYIAQLFKRG